MITTISKGLQITIPVDIREELGLNIGSKVDLEYEKGRIIIKPVGNDLEKVFAETKHLKPKLKLNAKQMDDLNEKVFR